MKVKKKIYLCGPMTGYPLNNFPAFDKAKADLEEFGWEVVSPADLDRELGYDPTKGDVIEEKDLPAFIKNIIVQDIKALVECDGVVMIKGWEQSKGANAELKVAQWNNMQVFELKDGKIFRI